MNFVFGIIMGILIVAYNPIVGYETKEIVNDLIDVVAERVE